MFPAIFLDRDGVIIENKSDYIRSWNDVKFFPEALAALAWGRKSSYKFVIITNQSAIGRGLVQAETAEEINRRVVAEIQKSGGYIEGVYTCPHKPSDHCSCRKPKPGLILQAASELSLDLSRSIMIGDAISDLQAGLAAGIQKIVLVKTGRGDEQSRLPLPPELKTISVYQNLEVALHDLLSKSIN